MASDTAMSATSQLEAGYTHIDLSRVRSYFRTGKVFRTLWPEPAGESVASSGGWARDSRYGELIAVKIRWFVVFRSYKEHCLALSIRTHGGRGAAKTGIEPRDFAPLVLNGDERGAGQDEDVMTKAAIHLIPEDDSIQLDPASYIDFSRVYTIEYQVKVKTVGRIAPADIAQLKQYAMETLCKGESSISQGGGRIQQQPSTTHDEIELLSLGRSSIGRDEESSLSPFRRRPRAQKFFSFGKVFSVLWSEPVGETVGPSTTASDGDGAVGKHAGNAYSAVRRFVVIREGHNYCIALAIRAYNRQGVGKRGIVKSEHSIIYTGKTVPEILADEAPRHGEEGMQPIEIRVNSDNRDDKLDVSCRINYGQTYTIQHNLKVAPFGQVHENSREALLRQFRYVWKDLEQESST